MVVKQGFGAWTLHKPISSVINYARVTIKYAYAEIKTNVRLSLKINRTVGSFR